MDDRTIEYGGLTIGAGTDYRIAEISGLGAPPVRSSDRPVLGRHGQSAGDDFYEARTIIVSTNLVEFTDAIMSTKRAVLAAAFAGGHDEAPLVLQIPGVAGGGRRRILCRPRRNGFSVSKELIAGVARDVFQLHATDPRMYDETEITTTAPLTSTTGGLTWPLTWPLAWGTTTSGIVTVTNAGNFPTGAVLTIPGPVTNPRVTNITTGEMIGVTLVVADGSTLVIDLAARTVLLNGTASRFSALTTTSKWWQLQPGANQLRYSADVATASTLSVVHRSAWIS